MSTLVTKKFLNFTAKAVMEDNEIKELDFAEYIKGKKAVLFFWPKDFTFVCPSEIIAYSKKIKEFEARNTKLIGVSVDSEDVHSAWKNTPINEGGIGFVAFPMVADTKKEIAKGYGVFHEETGVALRGTFIIDEIGIIRHTMVNDFPLGRNVSEAIRILDAIDFHKENGEVCPAGWNKGDEGMRGTTEGVATYLSKNADKL